MIESINESEFLVSCPFCSDEHTHHADVYVYERKKGEDGKSVILTPGSNVVESTDYNPSARRNAVSIEFWGECGHFWAMQIIQHKGQTFIKFP